MEERTGRKTGYLSGEQRDVLNNMKEEDMEEDLEKPSLNMVKEDDVGDEEDHWKEEEKERDGCTQGHTTDKLVQNRVKSEDGVQEGEELFTLATSSLHSCLQQPRVLIRRLEIAGSSVCVSSLPHLMGSGSGRGARSPWRWHEFSPRRDNKSLRQDKGPVTQKRKTVGQLERPLKVLPSSSVDGICAEASFNSPVMSSSYKNVDSDHTGENIKEEYVMDGSNYEGVEPKLSVNRFEDMEDRTERKTGYLMSGVRKDILTSMKKEEVEEHVVKPSLNMVKEDDDVGDEEDHWKEEEKERTRIKSEDGVQEGEELFTLATSCLPSCLKQPRVLIRRLEISGSSVCVSSLPHLMGSGSGRGARSPWRWHEFSPRRDNKSLRRDKGPVTQKRKTVGQLERPLKVLPSSSVDGICAEASFNSPVMSSSYKNVDSDHTGENMKEEYVMDGSNYEGVEPKLSVNRFEDMEDRTKRKTGYLMSGVRKDILTNMKKEEVEEDVEKPSLNVVKEDDDVGDEEDHWKEEEKERTRIKSEDGVQEGEKLFTLATSCPPTCFQQPRVLIRRLEISGSSVCVSSLPHLMGSERGQGARSPRRRHEVSPRRGNKSLRREKGQVTQKRKTVGRLKRPLKVLPSSSVDSVCAEASFISSVMTSRNRNIDSGHTGRTAEVSSQVFACSQCPFVPTEEVNLQQHIEMVHPQELDRTLGSQKPPRSTHLHPNPTKTTPTPTQSHSGTPGPHICSQCGKSFVFMSKLKRHRRIHTGEQPYRCSQCGENFGEMGHLRMHQSVHTGERPYSCSQCGKRFTRSDKLTQHQRTHTGERPHHCSECGRSFTRSSTLKQHQRTHTGERPHQCSQCEMSFTRSSTLKQHQRTHTGEHPYHCSLCGRSFSQSGTLKQHQRTHTGEHPYHCSLCEMSFTRSSTLKQHQRIHTGEHPYHCSLCEMSFSRSSTLKQHQRTHTGERPHHCSQCEMRFSCLGNLKQHQRTHTGEHPYHCSLCEMSFSRSSTLKQHQRTHTGEHPYHCSQCEMSFSQSGSLKQHQRTHR